MIALPNASSAASLEEKLVATTLTEESIWKSKHQPRRIYRDVLALAIQRDPEGRRALYYLDIDQGQDCLQKIYSADNTSIET
jgi:hypothetical protein